MYADDIARRQKRITNVTKIRIKILNGGVYVVHKVEFGGNGQFDEDIVISATYPFINESWGRKEKKKKKQIDRMGLIGAL
jgi:hypothetical protein